MCGGALVCVCVCVYHCVHGLVCVCVCRAVTCTLNPPMVCAIDAVAVWWLLVCCEMRVMACV